MDKNQIQQDIQNQITSKTAVDSITPTIVGSVLSGMTEITDYSLTGHTHTLDNVTTAGNTTTNIIDVSGMTTEYVGFTTVQHVTVNPSPGHVHWNEDEDTLEVHANGVTYQLGQEIAPLVRNQSGSLITNGTPVMFVGTQGNTGRILIAPAIADGSIPSSFILGVTTQDIANNADGHATWFGKIRDLNTTGSLYGETWNDSDILYVSPTTAGYLTNIKPEAPFPQIFMGVVINAHATSGDIFTRPSWRGKMTDLDDVNGTALTTDGQLVIWNNATQVFDFTHNINDYAVLSGVTTPTLDEVTTTGNTTTNTINVGGVTTEYISGTTSVFQHTDDFLLQGDKLAFITNFGGDNSALTVTKDDLTFISTGGGTITLSGNTNVSGNDIILELPSILPNGSLKETLAVKTDIIEPVFTLSGTSIYPIQGGNSMSSSYSNTIGGGINNTASGYYSVIGGGGDNTISGNGYENTISGGYHNTSSGYYGFIGGGQWNTTSGYDSVIGGGNRNIASGDNSSIVGGSGNTISSTYSSIGGGKLNEITSGGTHSLIGGGSGNTITNSSNSIIAAGSGNTITWLPVTGNTRHHSNTISGGYDNTIINPLSGNTTFTNNLIGNTISGGYTNTISGNYSTIVGGTSHVISRATWSTIVGGDDNTITIGGNPANLTYIAGAFIGGGYKNTVSGGYSVIGGGSNNTTSGYYSTIVNGEKNTASGQYSFIGNGKNNTASGQYSFIGNGRLNEITTGATYSNIGGGSGNTINSTYSSIGGGWSNITSGNYTTIGGGFNNTTSGNYSTIGGGRDNTASNNYSTIGGGQDNTVSGGYLNTVSGGYQNTISGYKSVIAGGGENNISSGYHNTISGGYQNTVSGYYNTIGGGNVNTASGSYSTVGGGRDNTTLGKESTVIGGRWNTAWSYGETAGGTYGTLYTGTSQTNWSYEDRLFNIGNGISTGSRSDAFQILKSGEVIAPSLSTAIIDSGDTKVLITKEYGDTNYVGPFVLSGTSIYPTQGSHAVSNNYSTIGGGQDNTASGDYQTIAGGLSNTISGPYYNTISGGRLNTNSGYYSTIGGGQKHNITGYNNTISGGYENTISGYYNTIGGGNVNTASGSYSTVGGGDNNTASGNRSTVGGGANNTAWSFGEWVGGVYGTLYTGTSQTNWSYEDRLFNIGNGVTSGTRSDAFQILKSGEVIAPSLSTAIIDSGDTKVLITKEYGDTNYVGPFVLSGTSTHPTQGSHTVSGNHNTIGGGENNTVSSYYSVIVNGNGNTTSGYYSSVINGFNNTASSYYSTIGGGNENTASGDYGTIINGKSNTASGNYSTVLNGWGNTAWSYGETVGGTYGTLYTGTSQTAWSYEDRLFNIGNGASSGTRSDALQILKSGEVIAPSLSTAIITSGDTKVLITKEYSELSKLKGYTVATLPGSPTQGDQAYVTDALTPTYHGTVTSGGTENVPVFYDGTNWIT